MRNHHPAHVKLEQCTHLTGTSVSRIVQMAMGTLIRWINLVVPCAKHAQLDAEHALRM